MLKVRNILGAILLALLVAGSADGQSQKPPETEWVQTDQQADRTAESQQAAAQQPNSAPESAGAVSLAPADNLHEERSGDHHKNDGDSSEFWIILGHRVKITDFFLAVFTGLLVLIGGWQGIQLKRTVDATREGAAALPKIERAYVFVKIQMLRGIVNAPNDTRQTQLEIRFANRGKTPAMLKKVRAYPVIQQHPPRELIAFPGSERELPPGYVIKADGEFGIDPVDVTRPSAELVDVEMGRTKLFLVGRIEYDDVLGSHRETGFCWEFEFLSGDFRPSETKLNYYK